MKKIALLLFLFGTFVLQAQLTNEGTPKSWDSNRASTSITPIVLPEVDVERLLQEDAQVKKGDAPFRFGQEIVVDYTLKNSGVWTTLENGDRIWRIRFQSQGAKTLNFVFNDFYLPNGGTIYLYSNDRQNLLGAYTHIENNSERMLGTWFVEGDDVWIEYFEPKAVEGQGILQIGKAVHGYRNIGPMQNDRGLNDSGNCNHDVDCPIDPALEDYKDVNKYSVAFVLLGGYMCTGGLVNNTTNDGTPYFLTANHCYAGNPATWSFRFKWISPNPVCAANQNSTNGPMNHVMSGSTLKAKRADTDFCLVQLNQTVPEAWELTWAGWDRTDVIPNKSFGIHHPSGDIMKVCVDDHAPTKQSTLWRIAKWDLGVTEGGSSGSPLFDHNGRVIGQLYGGEAECVGFDGVGYDVYGRFGLSWDGANSSQRLKDWLDPDGTEATTVDPLIGGPTASVSENDFAASVSVYPNPSNGIITIENTSGGTLSYEIYNVVGQTVTKGAVEGLAATLDLSNNQAGIYFIKLQDTQSNSVVTKKLVIK